MSMSYVTYIFYQLYENVIMFTQTHCIFEQFLNSIGYVSMLNKLYLASFIDITIASKVNTLLADDNENINHVYYIYNTYIYSTY